MKRNEADLGNQSVGRLLFRLALPAITAQLINVLYNIVDRMYIGHIPVTGTDALTGVGVTMPAIMAISAFAALVSMGGAPRASIMMGRGDNGQAERVLGNCTTMLVIMASVLTAVFLIFGRQILMVFGASGNTIGYAWDYMQIYAVGTVFVQLALGLNAFISAQGYAKTSMFTVLIGAVCNIILDPIFIFAFDMGVRGAALATIISQAVSSIWVLKFLTSKKKPFENTEGKPKALRRNNTAVPCAGRLAVYNAVYRERFIRLLQLVPAQIWRRHSGRLHDDTGERNAVFNAAPSGPYPGRAAHNQL